MSHPLTNLNSLVLNIMEDDLMQLCPDTCCSLYKVRYTPSSSYMHIGMPMITLHIINTYHTVLKCSYGLKYLLDHDLDETTPTLLIGDFNIYTL